VTRTTWPDVIELHDIADVTLEEVTRWANLFPHVRETHVFAGFPCIHLSSVRAYRQKLDGEGSNLFWRLLEVLESIDKVFSPFCRVKCCVENVASMDESARLQICGELGISPMKLDPADILPCSRPRIAWCSEPLYEMDGVELWKEKEYTRAYLRGGSVTTDQWIRAGWTWDAPSGTCFPTFMKCIPRQRPPPQPVGLARTDEETRQRWTEDSFRYPPCQYRSQFTLKNVDFPDRVLDASERELLLGFGPGHTASALSASDAKRSLQSYEDLRCSLCGDSFSILSFCIMAGAMLANWVPRMPPYQIVNRLGLAVGATCHPDLQVPMTRWLAYSGDTAQHYKEVELVKHLCLTVNHTSSDVRISTGEEIGKKAPAHASSRALWWLWKHLFKVKWNHDSHIIFLEMKMILLTLLWKCRDCAKVSKRWMHLEDSIVCLYILSKGRTSSKLLQPLCRQIGAVQLAMGSILLHSHVGSSENPTDAASRD
jgi:hypothetical protein